MLIHVEADDSIFNCIVHIRGSDAVGFVVVVEVGADDGIQVSCMMKYVRDAACECFHMAVNGGDGFLVYALVSSAILLVRDSESGGCCFGKSKVVGSEWYYSVVMPEGDIPDTELDSAGCASFAPDGVLTHSKQIVKCNEGQVAHCMLFGAVGENGTVVDVFWYSNRNG